MLKGLSGLRSKRVDMENNVKKVKYFCLGASKKKVQKQSKREKKSDILSQFDKNVTKANISTVAYMNKNLPLTNRALISLAGLDSSLLKVDSRLG